MRKIIKFRNQEYDITDRTQIYFEYKNIKRITEIEGLSEVTHLKRLHLPHNQITKIEGLENLLQLEFIGLGDNKLSSLNNVNHLKNLKKIICPRNNIQFVEDLSPLINLETLLLYQNQIQDVPGIDHFTKLRNIQLEKNELRKFPDLRLCSQLEDINLQTNHFRSLHGMPRFPSNLQRFAVWVNPLSKTGKEKVNSIEGGNFPWEGMYSDDHEDCNPIPEKYQELYDYYQKSPFELAKQYQDNPASLIEEEYERLGYEGDVEELAILQSNPEDQSKQTQRLIKYISLRVKRKEDQAHPWFYFFFDQLNHFMINKWLTYLKSATDGTILYLPFETSFTLIPSIVEYSQTENNVKLSLGNTEYEKLGTIQDPEWICYEDKLDEYVFHNSTFIPDQTKQPITLKKEELIQMLLDDLDKFF